MIQCVGCRNEDRNYCSRVCCSGAMKNALKMRALRPKAEIYVLFRDMRTYGFKEDYYREAANKGVQFIRYEPNDKPTVEAIEEGGRDYIRVTATDFVLGKKLQIDVDQLVLSAAVIPPAAVAGWLLPGGARQVAAGGLRRRGRLSLRHGALPETFVGVHQPGLCRSRTGADHVVQGHRGGLGRGLRGG
jgi:heterodisulfide reductase subunit A-like polyferredoxin